MVFDRDEVSSVAGSPPLGEASETATAGAKRAESDQRQARRSTVVEMTMDVQSWLRKQLGEASPGDRRAEAEKSDTSAEI